MRKTRRGLASACALLLLAGVTFATAPAASGASKNGDQTRFFVLNNNIENRRCGKYDFEALLKKVSESKVYPDILTLQQVSGQAELTRIKAQLKAKWNLTYEGSLSFTESDGTAGEKCTPNKKYQANAVLWRVDRFAMASSKGASEKRWTADAKVKEAGQSTWSPCKNVPESIKWSKTQAARTGVNKRSISIGVALKELQVDSAGNAKRNAKGNPIPTGKHVVVASVHWPKHPNADEDLSGVLDANACLRANMQETQTTLGKLITDAGLTASKTAMVIGGDMNGKVSLNNNWWENATGTLGFTDPIAVNCKAANSPNYPSCAGSLPTYTSDGDDRNRLNDEHRTTQRNRIDYIFIKNANTTNAASTVEQPSKGLLYSNHRAVRATVKWKS